MIPASLDLRCVYHSLSDSMEFFARVLRDRSLRNLAILIANREGIVQDINFGAISILGRQQTLPGERYDRSISCIPLKYLRPL